MISKYLTPGYIAAGVFALLAVRHLRGAAHSGKSRTEDSMEASEVGTDFMPNMWAVLSGHGFYSQNYTNILPGSANADPGGNAAANLGLVSEWDGSLIK